MAHLDSDVLAIDIDGFESTEKHAEYKVGFWLNDSSFLRDWEVISKVFESRKSPSHRQQSYIT